MKAIRALVKDRRRSQRGSVLSGVLIIVAFLAIISGALMTELSTNFLLSNALVNRVQTQATVNSAVELALTQMQTTGLDERCPTGLVTTPPLNGQTAIASFGTCFPTVHESPQFNATSANANRGYTIEATHTQVGTRFNDYIVGNPGGKVFDYSYGQRRPRWTLDMGGAVTGPTLVMSEPNGGQNPDQYLVIPYDCTGSNYCLSVLSDNGSTNRPLTEICPRIPTNARVETRPAASPTSASIVFYAAGAALTAVDISVGNGNGYGDGDNGNGTGCSTISTYPASQAIESGPIAFGSGRSDQVYVVTSDQNSSRLLRFAVRNGQLGQTPDQNLTLPWARASGLAASGSNLQLGISLAITFEDGGVALVPLASDGTMRPVRRNSVSPAGISGAPYWLGNFIGVGTTSGLYVFDSLLNLFAYPAPGSTPSISTTPHADSVGNWYFGADDGNVYLAQVEAGRTVNRTQFGPMSRIGSSVQVDGCNGGTWICVYAGAADSNTYLIPLDAHDVVVTACVIASPTECAPGVNPRVWTRVEVGVAQDARTVHVQGWSYYAP